MMVFQQLHRVHHLGIGALARRIQPVQVMQVLGPVQRKAHQEMILGQEFRPFLVDHIAVGLQGVVDLDMAGVVLFLQFHHQPEKVQPRQGGFPALERDGGLPLRMGQGAADHRLQHRRFHDGPAALQLPVVHLIGIEAVAAAHVAQPARGFDHYMDRRHGRFLPARFVSLFHHTTRRRKCQYEQLQDESIGALIFFEMSGKI